MLLSSGEPVGAPDRVAATAQIPLAERRSFRFALLFLLTMTELMPGALLSRAMPVLLRSRGASLQQLGVLSLIMLPWAFKALWAPLVDRLGARSRFGRYRSWLFVTHPILLVTLVLGSMTDVPALIISQRQLGVLALLWLSLVAATADTASHGLAVTLLSPEERGFGNGLQSAGMMTGRLVGGGLMLILVGKIGWRGALLILGSLVLLPLLGVALCREQRVDQSRVTLREIRLFFHRPRIWRWLFLATTVVGIQTIPGVSLQALFVDRGMSLAEIGMLKGIIGCGFGALGGVIGGFVVARLGRQRSFYVLNCAALGCLAALAFLVVVAPPGRWVLYATVIVDNCGLSACMTILYVMIMDRSRSHTASTDYTIQSCLLALFAALGMSGGGFVAGRFGMSAAFIVALVLMVGWLGVAARALDARDFKAVLDPPLPAASDEQAEAPAAPRGS